MCPMSNACVRGDCIPTGVQWYRHSHQPLATWVVCGEITETNILLNNYLIWVLALITYCLYKEFTVLAFTEPLQLGPLCADDEDCRKALAHACTRVAKVLNILVITY